jgi:phospholipase/carboxylesterase
MPPMPVLVIFLHGIGASGAQLVPFALSWKSSLPTARFAAPDAPFRADAGTGHKWFNVDESELRPDRIHTIRQAFDDLVREIVEREGFGNDLGRVAFVGVSQGAIVGLDAVASGRWAVGAMVSFAGVLPPFPIAAANRQTPILLVHGQNDKTIPPSASTAAASQLKKAGFDASVALLQGVGHTVSPDGAQLALDFLQKVFDQSSPISG